MDDAPTAITLVSSGFGCVTTDSPASLRLPGITYRPLRSTPMRDIEMSCFYRKDDPIVLARRLERAAAQCLDTYEEFSFSFHSVPTIKALIASPALSQSLHMASLFMALGLVPADTSAS